MRVFFPDCIISARSGLCIGWIDVQLHTTYVLAVVHLPFDLHEILRWLQMETITRQRPLTVVGSLTHQGDPNRAVIQQLGRQASERFCLELTRPDVYSLPTCLLLEDCEATSADPVLILYNQRQISACSLPNKSGVMRTSSGLSSFDPSTFGERGDGTVQPQRMGLQIETVLSVIQEGVQQLRMFKDWDISMDVKTQGGIWSVIPGLLASLTSVLVSMGTLVLLPFRSKLCHRLSSSPSFQRALTFTQTGCQIQAKYNHVQDLLDAYTTTGGERHTGRGEPVEQTSFSKRLEYLRTCNLFTYLLLDVLLGVSLMCWIHHNSWPDVWAEWIMSSANTTAGSLQTLLQWLMGAPAGLKLNSALAHFLGQFFLYHVYLWIGYLSAMQPVLSWVIWCMSLTGCLGVSVILAVACDMVSMLTFHIYCFYVYAARIYRLQLTGLLALSRLFRGKKWNVLRKRVDTCNYDVDQLFIGTLLFTILLFLFPTTLLFYVVFTTHRLAVIFLEGTLTKTIDFLRWLPVYSIVLWLTGSDMLMVSVYFDPLQQPREGSPTAMIMQFQHLGLRDVLLVSHEAFRKSPALPELSSSRNPVVSLALDLLTGCLVYPWSLAQNKT